MTTYYTLVPVKENSIISTLEITDEQMDNIGSNSELAIIINKWLDINNIRADIKITDSSFKLYTDNKNLKLVIDFNDNIVKFTLVNIQSVFDVVRVDRVLYLN